MFAYAPGGPDFFSLTLKDSDTFKDELLGYLEVKDPYLYIYIYSKRVFSGIMAKELTAQKIITIVILAWVSSSSTF